jgi:hypothetical protein
MRKALSVAFGAALLLGVAAPAASASTGDVTQTIKVHTVQTSFSFDGRRVFSFTERLSQDGRTVGHDAVTCTAVSRTIAHCIGVVIFTGEGDLFVTATGTSTGATGRVIGGTGEFTNAQGTLLVVSSPSGNTGSLTLRFHV